MKKIILVFAIIASLVGCTKKDDTPAPVKYELVSAFDGTYNGNGFLYGFTKSTITKLVFKVTSANTAIVSFTANYTDGTVTNRSYNVVEVVGSNSTSFTGKDSDTKYNISITFQGVNNSNIVILNKSDNSYTQFDFNGTK
jgi:hypothetical protein